MTEWLQAHLNEILNGVMVVALAALAWVGRRFGGKSAVPHDGEALEIAGAIIDRAQAERLEHFFDANARQTSRLADLIEKKTAAQQENTRVVEQLSRDLRDLTQEIIRSGK
ncbi:hypothetical protein ATO13_08461 [Stappia sp. 22II-S9-Z10]|nr:hypothetical protein ATO13_08461 [Stappia sp. 22II-S9-Z10]